MKRSKLDSLQVCRAIAALLVVFYHFSIESKIFLGHELLQSFFFFGHSGVNFFFVLSGFIICYTHWYDINTNLKVMKKYLILRSTRILPSYWSILIIVSVLYVFFSSVSLSTHSAITPLTFLKNFFLLSYDQTPIVSVAWTLQYEMIFYLFFATFIFSRKIGWMLLITWLVLICLFNFNIFMTSNCFLKLALNFYCTQFLMGCFIAYLIKKWSDYIIVPKLILLFGMIGFLIYGIQEDYYNRFSNVTNAMIYALFSALIILGLAKMESIKPIRLPIFLIFLGDASYAIYLTHNTLLSILLRASQHIPIYSFPWLCFVLQTLFVLGISTVIACIYYKFYELRLLSFIRAKIGKLNQPEIVAASLTMHQA